MTNESAREFGLTWPQKIMYMAWPVLLATLISMASSFVPESARTVFVLAMAAGLAIITWYVSAGWNFKIALAPGLIRIREPRRSVDIPLDRIGGLVRNGRFPGPTLWVVLRGADVGQEIPARGVDPAARELIEAVGRRSPGKKLTYVPIPLLYLRSAPEFVADLKQRIPPLTIDARLAAK